MTQVRSGQLLDGSIVNADIAAAAAIDWTKLSKVGSSLADLITRSAGDLTSGTLAQARFATEFSAATTGNIDDLNFANAATIRLTNATLATVRGLVAGTPGQRVTIVSAGAGQVNLAHQDAGSAAANRLLNIATSAPTSLAAGTGSATYVYDGTTARWRLVAHEQGAWITPTFAAGDYTGAGAMTWTVDAGDVSTLAYLLEGRKLSVMFGIATTTVGGTLSTALARVIPGGFTAAKQALATTVFLRDNGAPTTGYCIVAAAGTSMFFARSNEAAFTASTNFTDVFGETFLEVQ